MEVIDAIYKRRAVRSYTTTPVTDDEMRSLLQAAVHAPSAMNAQPWAFAIVQGVEPLRNYSNQAKTHLLTTSIENATHHSLHHGATDPGFNIFYDAGTLIIICAKPGSEFAAGDCCLAGENLMLAAVATGLGTCPIGFALPWLRLLKTKIELGIPPEYDPVIPIIVGHPVEEVAPTPRNQPDVVSWIK